MAAGRFYHSYELFKIGQEDAWERTARILRDIANYSTIVSRSLGGGELRASDFKEEDDCNDWLRVPGNDTPAELRRKEEDAIIEERKRGREQV